MLLASQLRLAVRAVKHKLRLLTAYDTFWPAARRGGRLLLRGRVGEFTRKLFNELPDARDVERIAPRRTGPPLFLAGHVLGHGGYDQLVLNVLKGLTEVGLNVCRDRRACFRKQLVPLELRPNEFRRKRHHARLAIAPPHLLHRYRPDANTAAYTMWETDTLPTDSVPQLNRCGLVVVPSSWGAQCFRANGVKVPIAVVPLGYDPAAFRLERDAEREGVHLRHRRCARRRRSTEERAARHRTLSPRFSFRARRAAAREDHAELAAGERARRFANRDHRTRTCRRQNWRTGIARSTRT